MVQDMRGDLSSQKYTKELIVMTYITFSLQSVLCSALIIGCSSGYQPSRVYVPEQLEAKQLEVEVSRSQSHVGYSFTDRLVLHAAGVYAYTEELSPYEEQNGQIYGGELGLHYLQPVAEGARFTFGVSGSLELWERDIQRKWSNPNSNRTVTQSISERADVFRPAAQLAFVYGRDHSVTLFTRLHRPSFSAAEVEQPIKDPLLLDYGAHIHLKFADNLGPFGLYAQVLRRDWLTAMYSIDGTVDLIDTIDAFIGLTYTVGGTDKQPTGLKVSHEEPGQAQPNR